MVAVPEKWPSGMSPFHPGPHSTWRPPRPSSGPGRPMSSTHRWFMSLAVHINGPGGNSMTIGPSLRSSGRPAYGVSEFGVNTNCFGVPSNNPNTSLATAPAAKFPNHVAMIDTDG